MLLSCVQAAAPSSAQAFTTTDVDNVAQWLYRNSGHSTPPPSYTCGAVCSELFALESATSTSGTVASRALTMEAIDASASAGLISGSAMSAAGTAALALGAGYLGWQIGTGIRHLFVEVPRPTIATGRGPLNGAGAEVAYVRANSVFTQKGTSVGSWLSVAHPIPQTGWRLVSPTLSMPYVYQFHYYVDCVNLASTGETFTGVASMLEPTTSTCNPPGPDPEEPRAKTVGYQYEPMGGENISDSGVHGTPDVTSTPGALPSEAAVRSVATAILTDSDSAGAPGRTWPRVGDFIADNVTHPPTAVIPTPTSGETWTEYSARLDALGFTGHTRDIRSYVNTRPDLGGNVVITTSPAPGTTLDLDEAFTVETNPDTADMPVAIPAPETGETHSAYTARLVALGLLGEAVFLTDATLDPDFGPDAITRTSPRTTPSGSTTVADYAAPGTTVRVYVNPETAPDPAGAPIGGGCDAWVHPALDLTPLQDIGLADVFPFGIPVYIIGALDFFDVSPITPSWDFHFPFAGEGTNMTVDLAMFDDFMPPIRAVLLFSALIAMGWGFWRLATSGPDPTRDID